MSFPFFLHFPPAAALSAALFPVLAAGAESPASLSPHELDPVVVTATATARLASDAPASIEVITREQLDLRPVLDLSDALRGSPGITLTGTGLGGRRGIRIRGMDPEYTLVLLDGRRVNAASDAIAHADFDLGWLPAVAIERIEVVRGPMSSLYGSEALGGVVNVITRKATDAWHGQFNYNGGTVAGGQGGGTTQTGFYAGGALVPGTLGLSVFGEHRDKEATVDPDDPRLSDQEGRQANTSNVMLTWTPDASQRIDLSHLHGHERRWRHALQSGTPNYVYENVDRIARAQTTLGYRGDWDWSQVQANAYRSSLDRDNHRSQGEPTRPQHLTDDLADARVTFGLGARHRLTAGGEWRREQLDDSAAALSGHVQAIQTGLFVQDEIAITDMLSLVLGDRGDHHPRYGWHHSPRAYAVWHVSETFSVKGGGGSGFKAPSLKQLSSEYSAVGGGGRFTIVGNPALQPERDTSYELSAGWDSGDWSLRATVFRNELNDLIQTVCVRDCGLRGRELRHYTNVARARIEGAELVGHWELPAALSLDANYSWTHARDLSADAPLTERPRRNGTVRLHWHGERLQASLRGEYVGPQHGSTLAMLPSYTLWALDARYAISAHISLVGGIDNLADKRPDESSALYPYPETGRYLHAGIELGF